MALPEQGYNVKGQSLPALAAQRAVDRDGDDVPTTNGSSDQKGVRIGNKGGRKRQKKGRNNKGHRW